MSYVCVRMCVRVCMHVFAHTCDSVCVFTSIYVCELVHLRLHACVHTLILDHCACMQPCLYARRCVHFAHVRGFAISFVRVGMIATIY